MKAMRRALLASALVVLSCGRAAVPAPSATEQPVPQPPPRAAASDAGRLDGEIELEWPPDCRQPGPPPPAKSVLHGLPVCDGGD